MNDPLTLEPSDVAAGENPEKVAAALARFRFHDVRDASDFDLGYRLLDAQFGPVNEIERREVLERWFAAGSLSPPEAVIRAHYYMLLLRDQTGEVAAVRDGFSAVNRTTGRVVSLLSHSLVLPAWRRSGVAALLRAAPVMYARRAARVAGIAAPEITLVSEMEALAPARADTIVRMLAYGHGGFRILPPTLFAYAQPDFRDVHALGIPAKPIPFLLLVRQVGQESLETLATERAVAILDHLGALHQPSVAGEQLPVIRCHALRNVPPDRIPLRVPPAGPHDHAAMAGLTEDDVFPLYPAEWRPETA